MLQALREAFALRGDGLALRLRVQCQVVGRAGRIDELLHGKAHAGLGLLVALQAVGHLRQRAGVQQVQLRGERRGRILQPVFRREAAVPDRLGHGRGGRCGRAVDRRHRDLVDRAVPERGGLVHILILQFGHPLLGQLQAAQRLEEAADRGAEGLEAMRVRLGQSVLCRVRKSRFGGLVLRASRWRRARCALACGAGSRLPCGRLCGGTAGHRSCLLRHAFKALESTPPGVVTIIRIWRGLYVAL